MEAETMEPVAKRIPASPELAKQAETLVLDFPECFWFRHPEAKVRCLDDVRRVVHHLREYGGWKAWQAAQNLSKCLSPSSSAKS
jgi:RIO-like serine/threonine protein kinase